MNVVTDNTVQVSQSGISCRPPAPFADYYEILPFRLRADYNRAYLAGCPDTASQTPLAVSGERFTWLTGVRNNRAKGQRDYLAIAVSAPRWLWFHLAPPQSPEWYLQSWKCWFLRHPLRSSNLASTGGNVLKFLFLLTAESLKKSLTTAD